MNWYLAKLVFQIISGDGNHTPQFDEQLRIICAEDKPRAFFKAKDFGLQAQECIDNVKHQVVQWKFINISELYKLNGWMDGAELYSRINEIEDADNYIAFTNKKAADIESGCRYDLLKTV